MIAFFAAVVNKLFSPASFLGASADQIGPHNRPISHRTWARMDFKVNIDGFCLELWNAFRSQIWAMLMKILIGLIWSAARNTYPRNTSRQSARRGKPFDS